VSLHLAPINALMVVSKHSAGADVILDGKSTAGLTPVQFSVEKGAHTLVLRKQGYLDETSSADLGAGQNFQFAPALRALGNADDIRNVGKFRKLFRWCWRRQHRWHGLDERSYPTQGRPGRNQSTDPRKAFSDGVHAGTGELCSGHHADRFKPIHKVVSVEKGGRSQSTKSWSGSRKASPTVETPLAGSAQNGESTPGPAPAG